MDVFKIKLDIIFDKENVYTNIFGENLLLYTIIKNIKINDNKKITLEEKKYLLEKTNFFNEFSTQNYHHHINIKEKINNNFNDYILMGFQEAVFQNDCWVDRYCSKNISYKYPNCNGLYEYIGVDNHICKSTFFKNNFSFNYFLNNNELNKFNYDQDFYTIYHGDILIYKDGLLKILQNNLSDQVFIENENLQNLIKYLFSDFSLDFKNDIKNLILKVHDLYNSSKKKKLNFNESLKILIAEKSNEFLYYVKSKNSRLVSHNFLFNIPIINNFKIPENFKDDNEISFNFIANVIPLSKDKAIIVSKKGFNINKLNVDSINLIEFCFLNTLMVDNFYRCKSQAESSKVGGGDNIIHLINNSLIFYYANNFQNDIVDKLIKKMSKGPERSTSVENCIIYTMKNIKNNLKFENISTNKILFKKMLDDLFKEN